ncbi:MAG: glycoside hydrolase family 32 protein, partial [Rhodospirillales bacterium]|nr:glycoside hydrolase family 32 protein [Acetobacter sp.]
DEKYRPQYHFRPQKGWIGDPDGLVKWKGNYHLFWWGHAVSRDLVHWKELSYPMKGGNGFTYFSGSVIIDKNNTAGFGDSSMIAVYTEHKNDSVPEYQSISFSQDDSIFHYYQNNPVLDIGSNSFRDPQVFWYEPKRQWIMIVTNAQLHKESFYSSPDVKHWTHLSDFGPMGSYNSDWEVPDLFQLPVDGNFNQKKWVLSIGQGPNRMQYFLGDFDGTTFTPDAQTVAQNKRAEPALWAVRPPA